MTHKKKRGRPRKSTVKTGYSAGEYGRNPESYFKGIVWGFTGETMTESQIRIVSYWSDEQKNMAIKAFDVLGYWEINFATTDDLNVGLSDLIMESEKAWDIINEQPLKEGE